MLLQPIGVDQVPESATGGAPAEAGGLQEVRQKIIKSRIEHLEDEIRTFEENIRDLGGEP
jgi:hypothetical protein